MADTVLGRILDAVVKGGQLVLDEPLDLPEGCQAQFVILSRTVTEADLRPVESLDAAVARVLAEKEAGVSPLEEDPALDIYDEWGDVRDEWMAPPALDLSADNDDESAGDLLRRTFETKYQRKFDSTMDALEYARHAQGKKP